MMKATVHVTLKPSILDPQGEAIQKAVSGLGMKEVESVRIGKLVELQINSTDVEKTKARLNEICRDLLSNPVIENYTIDLKQA